MCRPISLRPEVARSTNQSGIEMLIPDSIYDDSGNEPLRLRQQRFSQFCSTTALCKSRLFNRLKDFQKTPRYDFTGIRWITTTENRKISKLTLTVFKPSAIGSIRLYIQTGFTQYVSPRKFNIRIRSLRISDLLFNSLCFRRFLLFEWLQLSFQVSDLLPNSLYRSHFCCRQKWAFIKLRTREDSCQPVIVLYRDRIKLVVVTSSTGDGQSQKRPRNGIDPFVPFIGNDLLNHRWSKGQFFPIGGTQADESERRKIGGLRFWNQIGCELQAEKLVVRHILVERLNDPVTIHPASICRALPVGSEIRVSRQIQPHSGPSLAEVG